VLDQARLARRCSLPTTKSCPSSQRDVEGGSRTDVEDCHWTMDATSTLRNQSGAAVGVTG